MAKGEALKNALEGLRNAIPELKGVLLASNEGLPIAHALTNGSDPNRVAAMALTAYREGAAPISAVLEAQRTARETLSAYIDDVARAWIANATLRTLSLTVTTDSTP